MQRSFWALVRSRHGVVTRAQLRALGLTDKAIRHRVDRGRLHPVWPLVYAVGRPDLTREGRWMAAVLTCGEGAILKPFECSGAVGDPPVGGWHRRSFCAGCPTAHPARHRGAAPCGHGLDCA